MKVTSEGFTLTNPNGTLRTSKRRIKKGSSVVLNTDRLQKYGLIESTIVEETCITVNESAKPVYVDGNLVTIKSSSNVTDDEKLSLVNNMNLDTNSNDQTVSKVKMRNKVLVGQHLALLIQLWWKRKILQRLKQFTQFGCWSSAISTKVFSIYLGFRVRYMMKSHEILRSISAQRDVYKLFSDLISSKTEYTLMGSDIKDKNIITIMEQLIILQKSDTKSRIQQFVKNIFSSLSTSDKLFAISLIKQLLTEKDKIYYLFFDQRTWNYFPPPGHWDLHHGMLRSIYSNHHKKLITSQHHSRNNSKNLKMKNNVMEKNQNNLSGSKQNNLNYFILSPERLKISPSKENLFTPPHLQIYGNDNELKKVEIQSLCGPGKKKPSPLIISTLISHEHERDRVEVEKQKIKSLKELLSSKSVATFNASNRMDLDEKLPSQQGDSEGIENKPPGLLDMQKSNNFTSPVRIRPSTAPNVPSIHESPFNHDELNFSLNQVDIYDDSLHIKKDSVASPKSARRRMNRKGHIQLDVLRGDKLMGAKKVGSNQAIPSRSTSKDGSADRKPCLKILFSLPSWSNKDWDGNNTTLENQKTIFKISKDFNTFTLNPVWNSTFHIPLPIPKQTLLDICNSSVFERSEFLRDISLLSNQEEVLQRVYEIILNSLLDWWSRGSITIEVLDGERFNEEIFLGQVHLLMSSYMMGVKKPSELEIKGTYHLAKQKPTNRVSGSIKIHSYLHVPELSYISELLKQNSEISRILLTKVFGKDGLRWDFERLTSPSVEDSNLGKLLDEENVEDLEEGSKPMPSLNLKMKISRGMASKPIENLEVTNENSKLFRVKKSPENLNKSTIESKGLDLKLNHVPAIPLPQTKEMDSTAVSIPQSEQQTPPSNPQSGQAVQDRLNTSITNGGSRRRNTIEDITKQLQGLAHMQQSTNELIDNFQKQYIVKKSHRQVNITPSEIGNKIVHSGSMDANLSSIQEDIRPTVGVVEKELDRVAGGVDMVEIISLHPYHSSIKSTIRSSNESHSGSKRFQPEDFDSPELNESDEDAVVPTTGNFIIQPDLLSLPESPTDLYKNNVPSNEQHHLTTIHSPLHRGSHSAYSPSPLPMKSPTDKRIVSQLRSPSTDSEFKSQFMSSIVTKPDHHPSHGKELHYVVDSTLKIVTPLIPFVNRDEMVVKNDGRYQSPFADLLSETLKKEKLYSTVSPTTVDHDTRSHYQSTSTGGKRILRKRSKQNSYDEQDDQASSKLNSKKEKKLFDHKNFKKNLETDFNELDREKVLQRTPIDENVSISSKKFDSMISIVADKTRASFLFDYLDHNASDEKIDIAKEFSSVRTQQLPERKSVTNKSDENSLKAKGPIGDYGHANPENEIISTSTPTFAHQQYLKRFRERKKNTKMEGKSVSMEAKDDSVSEKSSFNLPSAVIELSGLDI